MSGSQLVNWAQLEARLKKLPHQGSSPAPLPPADDDPSEPTRLDVEEFTDDHTLDSDDLGKMLMMNAATAKTFTLPAVGADDIGLPIVLVKRGAGKLTIQAGGTDTIQDSTAGGTLYNDLSQAEDALPLVKLRVIAAGVWLVEQFTGQGWRTS